MFNKNINYKKIKPNTEFIAQNIFYYKTVNSTNTAAKNTDCKSGTLFIAETQTNGKGRMGRDWLSAKKNGIWMSIALMPKINAEHINQITLVTGVAVCETLIGMYKLPFKIKWPNDIVIEGKKVCGILVEGILEKGKITKVINGIGINVNQKNFTAELADKATSVYMLTGKKTDRTEIINKFSEIFEKYYNEFLNNGIKNIMVKYRDLCVTLNKDVMAIKDGKKIKAVATGITENGELIIKKEDGTTMNINSGEVSVRGIYGYI